ncbi:MAG: arginine--tRNA ligase [Planctomycetota bacterium]|nr:MAG: arginine--tRNA ligase [Planctomycetota bacterium]
MSRYARAFAEVLAPLVEAPAEELTPLIGAPPRPEMGQLAFPCFGLAKTRRTSPVAIATELVAQLAESTHNVAWIESVSAAGPYVNLHLCAAAVAAEVLPDVLAAGAAFGGSTHGGGRAVTVDYSSPNIAKSFGVHHLRSTVIGHALVGMLRAAGYRPVGINHLGDWGTQFGQLLAIWQDEGDEERLAKEGIDYLLELYVEFNRRKEEKPELQERARECFKSLEQGDAEARRLWALFRATSLREFERVYAMLGIEFDNTAGESFYEDKMPAVVEELESKGLLVESEGATVVDLEPYELGAALIRKADGSTLYLTRDLASAEWRHKTFDFARSLYVVGGAQALHFAQLKKVLELLGRDWHELVEHVPFGLMRFKDRKMSTRKGDIIRLEDVLLRAVKLARETIESGAEEKGRALPPDIDELAHRIGVGAVVFNDLKNRRQRDVVFDWNEVLSFEGETGPYLQYTAARIGSMIEKADAAPSAELHTELLVSEEELAVLLAVDGLPGCLLRALKACEPSIVADTLLDIAARFSTLYARRDADNRRDWQVLTDDPALSAARLGLASAVRTALVNGLGWLGVPVPDRM